MDYLDQRVVFLAKEIVKYSDIMSDARKDDNSDLVEKALISARSAMAELSRVFEEKFSEVTDEPPFR